MSQAYAGRKRIRRSFGRIPKVLDMPNLIEVQKYSYDQFLQAEEPDGGREDMGLQAVFKSVFPIDDFAKTSRLEFVSYEFEQPKYDVEECQQRGMTFAAPLKVTLNLIVYDVDEETEARSIKGIKQQEVYMGDLPLMTSNGTFVVNGTERVIVSQMHRSPGVFFDHDRGKTHASGKLLFAARVIPYRGSWLDLNLTLKIFFLYVLIAVGNCRQQCCCMRLTLMMKKSCLCSMKASTSRARMINGLLLLIRMPVAVQNLLLI